MRLRSTVYQRGNTQIQLAGDDQSEWLVVRLEAYERSPRVTRASTPKVIDVRDQYRDGSVEVYVLEHTDGHVLEEVLRRHGQRVGAYVGAPCLACQSPLDAEDGYDEAAREIELVCNACGAMYERSLIDPAPRAPGRAFAQLGSALPLEVGLELVIQTAEALDHAATLPEAHVLGWLPHLVHISRTGVVRVVNPSVARRLASRRFEDPEMDLWAFADRWRYLAPEARRGAPRTARSSSFEVALLLYEVVTGVHPYSENGTLTELMSGANDAEVPPLTGARASLGSDIEKIVMAALSRSEQARPSPGELADQLRRAARALPTPPSPEHLASYLARLGEPLEPYAQWPIGLT